MGGGEQVEVETSLLWLVLAWVDLGSGSDVWTDHTYATCIPPVTGSTGQQNHGYVRRLLSEKVVQESPHT